ncbi:MAG: hypothetical protein ACKO96_01890, partial [Flammeovirgaceae bacterium]
MNLIICNERLKLRNPRNKFNNKLEVVEEATPKRKAKAPKEPNNSNVLVSSSSITECVDDLAPPPPP